MSQQPRGLPLPVLLFPLLVLSCKSSGPEPDAALDDAAPAETGARPGKIVITEVMADPRVAYDADGEWLELHNPGSQEVDLTGWTLKDDGSDQHVFKAARIAAGGYLVVGRNSNKASNGGVPVDYLVDGFNLNNNDDQIVLLDASGAEVDRVAYQAAWGVFPGISLGLRSPELDNNLPASWCPAASPWAGSGGDLGSPGAATSCGSPPDAGTADAPPYLKNSISFNSSLCASLESGVKKITLRNKHWTWIVAGEWVKLTCGGKTWKTQLTAVRLTTWGGVQPDEYTADGFSSQSNMMQIMETYYPGITLTSPATVIRWDSITAL